MQRFAPVSLPITIVSSLMAKIAPFSLPETAVRRGGIVYRITEWCLNLNFSVQPLCSLCLCGSPCSKTTTETQRTQRLHREEAQIKTPLNLRNLWILYLNG